MSQEQSSSSETPKVKLALEEKYKEQDIYLHPLDGGC